ncbi:MAG TPA: hypothetical protein VHE36_11295 [Sphingomicrobium sp.]|nr:hypothetical protein [Sphingomicrobium sp.]
MLARFVLIAAAALASATAFAAEPSKAPAPASTQPRHPAPPQVVLASAEDVHSPPSADQQSPPAAKRRVARVTTCRCGDQQAQPQQ